MVTGSGRRGRPWAPIEHLDSEMTGLVQLLRDLIDQAGGGLRELRKRLTPEDFNGTPPPSYSTLSQRLWGDGLQNDGVLVMAIVATCAPAEQADAVADKAQRLLAAARARSALRGGGAPG